MAISTIELFAGVGMLGEGVGAGLAFLGEQHRSVCYIEREAYAASVLVARMEEGSLAKAPIWSDVTTFDASQFVGKVDGILAGFPCQDLSIAGARAGLDGSRSGLFFEIPKIAAACGAWFLFLENVAAIASATATTVDETEGCLEERAAARVLGELADCGWDAEWITLSASDVGASHGRARWFCFAWRKLADTSGQRLQESRFSVKRELSTQIRSGLHYRPKFEGGELGNSRLQSIVIQQRQIWPQYQAAGSTLADTKGQRAGERSLRGGSGKKQPGFDASCIDMADTNRTGLGTSWREESWTFNPASSKQGLFAPGPEDARWRDILARSPELAPALESTFCGLVNGLAFNMDDSRAEQLKCVGNGVVALCAATAFVVLARRSGLFA